MAYLGVGTTDLPHAVIGPRQSEGGIATTLRNVGVLKINISPVAVGTGGVNGGMGEQMFSVPGLRLGDFVVAIAPDTSGVTCICSSRVSAQDTLAITWVRTGNALVTPVAGIYQVLVIR